MNEKAFNDIKKRELKRFYSCVDTVVDDMLLKKYEETRKAEEYRDYARICNFVKTNLRLLDLVADRMPTLFEVKDDRSNWEIYLAGLRQVTRKMPESYLFRYVLPMFGLDDVREKLNAYSARWLDQFHATQRTLQQVDVYVKNLGRGISIAQEYGVQDNDLPRLYASIKTWTTKDELDRFTGSLTELLDLTVEVFVVGPVQLYLMLGRDTFALIFKALSINKLTEVRGDSKELQDLLSFHDFVHDLVSTSVTIGVMQQVLKGAMGEYNKRLREEQDRLRAALPDKEMRYRFAQRFESGILFRVREA